MYIREEAITYKTTKSSFITKNSWKIFKETFDHDQSFYSYTQYSNHKHIHNESGSFNNNFDCDSQKSPVVLFETPLFVF